MLRPLEQALTRVLTHRNRLLVLCLVGAAVLSWTLGQDANWDLKNYHLYNAYALLAGRWGIDFIPASLQTFFNPLADVPYYVLATKVLLTLPRALAAVQGLYYGALVYFVFLVNWHAFGARTALPATTSAIATLIGVSAAAVVGETGTTYNDIQGALFIFWGLFLLMPRSDADVITTRRALWAGVAFGAAVGVKLTYGYYALAVVAAVLASEPPTRAIRTIVLVGIGGAASALVLVGPWCLWVFHQTGNPVFPVFNEFFRSDWYPPIDYARFFFKPPPLSTALTYPFVWTKTSVGVVSEVPFRDARFAAAWISGVVILTGSLLALCARQTVRRDVAGTLALGRPMRFLFVFALAAYLVWLTLLGILRFGIMSEVLTGMVIVLGLQVAVAGVLRPAARAGAVIVLAVALGVGLQAMTIYPTWGRLHYEQRTYTVVTPPLPPRSMVVLAGTPLSFVVPFLRSNDFVAIGISHHHLESRAYRLFAETKKRILGHTGPVFVVTDRNSEHLRGLATEFGITWANDSCVKLFNNVEQTLRWCQGQIIASP